MASRPQQSSAEGDPHPLTIVAADLKAVGAQRRLRASLRLCRCCNPNDSGGRWKIIGRRHTIYRQGQPRRERAPRRRLQSGRSAVNERRAHERHGRFLTLVTAGGNVSFAEFHLRNQQMKCARLLGACGRCRVVLHHIVRLKCVGGGRGLRKQITLRHAVTAFHLVLNPDANGVAKIVRISRQIADLVMDYHFVGLANGCSGLVTVTATFPTSCPLRSTSKKFV